jgi:Protein of unknown function (DUF1566)
VNRRKRVAAVLLASLATGSAYAAAPVGRYSFDSQIVTDHRTHLTWQRVVSPESYTQAQAGAYCAGLLLSGGGWRLPGIAELQSIMDVTRTGPSIDGTAFPDTPNASFWSATIRATTPTSALMLDFSLGMTMHDAVSRVQRVRCVR